MLNRAIDPVLMEMMVCLAEEGSFTAVAERMHLTQQAVSAQVKRLEALTGQQIVIRSPHDVHLTQAGEKLLIYARQVMALAERLRLQFSSAPLEGTVRFGFTPGLGAPMLFPVLSEIRRLHPRLELRCETGRTKNLLYKLEAGKLDLIIGAQAIGETGGETLCRERLTWVGDAERLVQPNAPIPLVMLPNPTFLRDHVFKLLDDAGRAWSVFFESDDVVVLRAAVQSGWGVSIFNRVWVEGNEGLVSDHASELLPDAGYVEFFLRYRNQSRNVVKSFAGVLRDVLGDL
ncbi:LysR family transcriptional regulator [Paraburkholderia bryophila]|uniref:LysR family transcriptional regulator n=1 Tax=Paraburkholderia bryophila TaxID=420952 RepID=UPI00234BDD3D|nr:LysR family transcriptional regulator [Paraburkholderia bryophila]WCM19754.1 LysR family transcriptional regulator [Paraburkholderia bryophila]